jgi:hypothetical protein
MEAVKSILGEMLTRRGSSLVTSYSPSISWLDVALFTSHYRRFNSVWDKRSHIEGNTSLAAIHIGELK